MKRLVSFLIITSLLMVTFPLYAIMADMPVYGDANGDGNVDIHDCINLAQHLAKISGTKIDGHELNNVDMNRDDHVDIMDLVILLQYITDTDHHDFPEIGSHSEITEETFAPDTEIPDFNQIDAGTIYLNAVAAAGKVYDDAIDYASDTFDTAVEGIQLSSGEYKEFLDTYRKAVNDARNAYNNALDDARSGYEAATGLSNLDN